MEVHCHFIFILYLHDNVIINVACRMSHSHFSMKRNVEHLKSIYLLRNPETERHRLNSNVSSSEAARFYFSTPSESPQPCIPGVKQIDIITHRVAALHCVRSTLLTPATITPFLPLSLLSSLLYTSYY